MKKDVASNVSTEKSSLQQLASYRSASAVWSCKELWGSGRGRLSQLAERLLNSAQRRFFPQNLQRFEQGWRVFAAAYGYADGLKHLSGFKSKLLGGGAQSLIQGVVFEIHLGKNGLCLLEGLLCHGSIAFLRN